jgi:hypothetical protein
MADIRHGTVTVTIADELVPPPEAENLGPGGARAHFQEDTGTSPDWSIGPTSS